MYLSQHHLTHFRNFSEFSIEPHPRFNFIYGDNGSGKTSILESIFLLTRGKSFRAQHTQAIEQNQNCLTVRGVLKNESTETHVGIQRCVQSLKNLIKIDGEVCRRLSDLTALMPTQVIHPESYLLISGAPSLRRRFLDWGLFHVKPNYHFLWKTNQRLLLQRNEILKSGNLEGLEFFEQEFIKTSNQIDGIRKAYFVLLEQSVNEILTTLSFFSDIKIDYKRGWSKEVDLSEVLKKQREKDIQFKQTQSGPHRADFVVDINGEDSKGFISRGQQKILVTALLMAQLEILAEKEDKSAIVLIDDLSSELDENHQIWLLDFLNQRAHQTFISSIEKTHVFSEFNTQGEHIYLT